MRKLFKMNSGQITMTIVFIMFVLMSFTFERDTKEPDNNFETIKNLDIFYTLYKETNLYYVDPIVPGDLIKTGIDAMLKSLDPYTVYIPESKVEDIKFMRTGQYGGIGAVIRKKGEYTMIYQPYEGSPAVEAGLLAGDVLIEIDGRAVKGMKSEQVSELLRGEPETIVSLKLERIGEKDLVEVDVTRKEIKRNSVPYYGLIEDKVGYIALSSFTNTAGSEVTEALLDLKETHNIESVVLDLRGNPGGLLIEAVKICNLFIEKGELIVSTKGKVAQWDKEYTTFTKPIDTEMKVVVIVSRTSASASEIVSGAIQDLDRGVVIGQRTFGKGLVQTTRNLSYNGILKVTTAKYYIPSGRCIQALDYSNRNADGSVGHVPDSLISEFQTQSGRLVYDGGGVTPDVKVEIEKLSMITSSLVIKDLVFDYANQYKYKIPEIASPEEFALSENDFTDFVNFLQDKDYDYQTRTEKELEILIETSKEEKYFSEAEVELNALKEKFAHDKDKDLMMFKDEIMEQITYEIIMKYYYEKGGIIYGLKHDNEIKKAIELLNNEAEYNSILQP